MNRPSNPTLSPTNPATVDDATEKKKPMVISVPSLPPPSPSPETVPITSLATTGAASCGREANVTASSRGNIPNQKKRPFDAVQQQQQQQQQQPQHTKEDEDENEEHREPPVGVAAVAVDVDVDGATTVIGVTNNKTDGQGTTITPTALPPSTGIKKRETVVAAFASLLSSSSSITKTKTMMTKKKTVIKKKKKAKFASILSGMMKKSSPDSTSSLQQERENLRKHLGGGNFMKVEKI